MRAYGGDDTIAVTWSKNLTHVYAGEGDDHIIGAVNSIDMLFGETGDDLIIGGGGEDIIDGGLGNDTISSEGDPLLSNYGSHSLQLNFDADITDAVVVFDADNNASHWTVSDLDGSKFGTDQIYGEATLQFNDQRWLSSDAQALLGMNAEDISDIIEIYIAHFNRAPDALGLHFWAARFADGMTLEEISEQFYLSVEALKLPSAEMNNADYVDELYQSVLGRAADAAGGAFWTQVLDSSALQRADFMKALLDGVSAPPADADANTLAEYQQDRAHLDSKVDIGVYFAMIKGLSDAEDARTVMQPIPQTEEALSAKEQIDFFAQEAMAADTGEFIVQILGVIDDPFTTSNIIAL